MLVPAKSKGAGEAEQTYVDTQDRQVGLEADQQLPLPRNFSHTHLRHSALTYFNLPSNLTPLIVCILTPQHQFERKHWTDAI